MIKMTLARTATKRTHCAAVADIWAWQIEIPGERSATGLFANSATFLPRTFSGPHHNQLQGLFGARAALHSFVYGFFATACETAYKFDADFEVCICAGIVNKGDGSPYLSKGFSGGWNSANARQGSQLKAYTQ